ncbi:hypothetical protein Y032_0015g2582 [Ancylostoma ceylanicum]|uniref:Sulfur globule protein CV3 family protein n=1 Tax=Ancylostoma ceylanicum TaxID=53326 RepID=A0A016V775_9BILA|nr:hypothetical protein Y032_0015g2582 [Ancylostoma ceylanicum]
MHLYRSILSFGSFLLLIHWCYAEEPIRAYNFGPKDIRTPGRRPCPAPSNIRATISKSYMNPQEQERRRSKRWSGWGGPWGGWGGPWGYGGWGRPWGWGGWGRPFGFGYPYGGGWGWPYGGWGSGMMGGFYG